jgi:hypothetical protein
MDRGREFLEEPDVPPSAFFSVIDGGMQGLILIASIGAACGAGLFDALEVKPRTAGELSDSSGIAGAMLVHLLDLLCHTGICSRSGAEYRNTPLASTYLVSSSPYSQQHYLRKNMAFLDEIWARLPERLSGGPLIFDRERFFHELSLPAMADNALCGRLQRTVREVAALPEFHSCRKMVDLGGGHGLYAIAFTFQNPRLSAVVFDLPHIVPLADAYIREYGAERVSVLAGNFFSDSFGTGYDLIFSSSNPSGKSIELLPFIAGALNPGGLFVNVQSDDHTSRDAYQALEWELWSIGTAEKGQGQYSREQPFLTPEYRHALAEAGLSIIREVPVRDDYHAGTYVHLMIARKPGKMRGDI